MKIRPIQDRVLVKLDEREEVTPGGIILPDEAKRKPQKGTVVSVGPGELRKTEGPPRFEGMHWPMSVRPGDRVVFSSYAGVDIGEIPEMKGYVLLSDRDIAGVIEQEADAPAVAKKR
jgi:chaperonin GroES